MCKRHKSCSISKDTGLGTAFTVAHEMGHRYREIVVYFMYPSANSGCVIISAKIVHYAEKNSLYNNHFTMEFPYLSTFQKKKTLTQELHKLQVVCFMFKVDEGLMLSYFSCVFV